jgi:hypothetical protein
MTNPAMSRACRFESAPFVLLLRVSRSAAVTTAETVAEIFHEPCSLHQCTKLRADDLMDDTASRCGIVGNCNQIQRRQRASIYFLHQGRPDGAAPQQFPFRQYDWPLPQRPRMRAWISETSGDTPLPLRESA